MINSKYFQFEIKLVVGVGMIFKNKLRSSFEQIPILILIFISRADPASNGDTDCADVRVQVEFYPLSKIYVNNIVND